MRKSIFALTVFVLAPSAVMAMAPSGERVGGSDLGIAAAANQKGPIAPASGIITSRQGSSADRIILALGDMAGDGPGAGGQKGQKKGGYKGKQPKGKDNPNKGGANKGDSDKAQGKDKR